MRYGKGENVLQYRVSRNFDALVHAQIVLLDHIESTGPVVNGVAVVVGD